MVIESCAYRVAILGAGVAGSTCAASLLRMPGIAAVVYDMGGRGPGGRTCSRPVDGQGGSFSPADRGGRSSLSEAHADKDLTFDHGAQAFTVSHPEVRALTEAWERAGFVGRWEGTFGKLDASTGAFVAGVAAADSDDTVFGLLGGSGASAADRFVGVPSMGALARGILSDAAASPAAGSTLTSLFGAKATGVTYSGEGEGPAGARWTVKSSDGVSRHFDAVVTAGHAASFAAQAAASLPGGGGSGGSVSVDALRGVSYPAGCSPLYSLLVAFESPLGDAAPFDGAGVASSDDLRWISRDSSKPSRQRSDGLDLWVALSTEGFARRVEEQAAAETAEAQAGAEAAAPRAQGGSRPTEAQLQCVAAQLLEALRGALHAPLPPVAYVHAQRWQAGITRAPLGLEPPCASWEEYGLFACGDWAAKEAKVEEAALSGLAAAQAVGRAHDASQRMRSLLSTAPPPGGPDAAAALEERARASWGEWRCAAYSPETPAGRFRESRWWDAPGREAAAEERCLVTAGRATLWPEGGGPPVEIAKGDWVTFRRGFQCTWVVNEDIAKRYAYFDAEGAELACE
mmetsp:Transcript_36378/g.118327  ORF Transcript_36378/g.118327 Transcript_36378/m.118327 type:complete len:572 (+) Transcript_36378:78-1793(+)